MMVIFCFKITVNMIKIQKLYRLFVCFLLLYVVINWRCDYE